MLGSWPRKRESGFLWPNILSDRIAQASVQLRPEHMHQQPRRIDLFVSGFGDEDESPSVPGEMEIAPGPVVLVGLDPGPVSELHGPHPHEVDHMVGSEVEQRLPFGRLDP